MLANYIGFGVRGKNRDSSVELLRIYACFFVVLAHIQLGVVSAEGNVFITNLIIKCLIADNVPIFFTILGFYFFTKLQDENRIKNIPTVFVGKIKGFLIRVYIPTLIVTLICVFAFDYIYGNPDKGVHFELLTDYVFKQQPQDMIGQFWYIIEYIKLLILFPLLAFICVDSKPYNIIRRSYMGLIFFAMVINDLSFLYQSEPFLNLWAYIPNKNILFLLIGYEVYLISKNEKILRRNKIIIGAVAFAAGLLARILLTLLSYKVYGVGNADHFMVMDSAPSYLCAGGLLLFFAEAFKGRKSYVVSFLGEMTLYIYMLHGIFLRLFGGVGSSIANDLLGGDTSGLNAVIYYVLYGGLLCVVSIVCGFVIRELYGLVRYACARIRQKHPLHL